MNGQILPLARLEGYRLAVDEPDVRGWRVFGSDGQRIGSVDDLLVDTASGRVRYLDVDLEHGLYTRAGTAGPSPAGIGPMTEHVVRESLSDEENRLTGAQPRYPRSRHVLIPLEVARLNEGARAIRLERLHTVEAADLPEYGGEGLGSDEDEGLRRRFNLEAVTDRT